MDSALHLAIDTSTSRPSVALMKGALPLHDWLGPEGLRHHETLLIGVNECFQKVGVSGRDLAYLSVGVGPGLFTGLRIGVATAKFLSEPFQLPCVAVSSLLALAHQSGALGRQTVWAVSDAKSRRVYALKLTPQNLPHDYSAPEGEEVAVSPEEAGEKIQSGDLLVGEGALLYRDIWPKNAIVMPDQFHALKGSSVGAIGYERYKLGLTCTALDLQPTYLKTGQPHL